MYSQNHADLQILKNMKASVEVVGILAAALLQLLLHHSLASVAAVMELATCVK